MKILEMEEKTQYKYLMLLSYVAISSICKGKEKEIGVQH